MPRTAQSPAKSHSTGRTQQTALIQLGGLTKIGTVTWEQKMSGAFRGNVCGMCVDYVSGFV